jgi:hypothetical protein
MNRLRALYHSEDRELSMSGRIGGLVVRRPAVTAIFNRD